MKIRFRSLSPALGLAAALALAPTAFAQDAVDAGIETTATTQAPTSWNDIDTNGDGVISAEESAATPALAGIFAEADANADGELTGEEYRAFVAAGQAEAAAGSTAADAGYDDGTGVEPTGEADAEAGADIEE